MTKLIPTLITFFVTISSYAAEFKCYSSKYPEDMTHFFEGGYTILNVTEKNVNLKYYYNSNSSKKPVLEIEADYTLGGAQGGKGSLKDLMVGKLVDNKSFPGDSIDTIYFEKTLLNNVTAPGIVGKFAFTGHGYSYDWNICYNKK